MTLQEPLDFEYWFVQVFSGDRIIFTLLSVLFITYLCAKFRMENRTTFILLAAYILIISAVLSNILYAVVLFLVAIFFAPKISKLLARQ